MFEISPQKSPIVPKSPKVQTKQGFYTLGLFGTMGLFYSLTPNFNKNWATCLNRLVWSGNCARVVIQLDYKFTQIYSLNRLNFKWLSQFLPLLLSAAMDVTLLLHPLLLLKLHYVRLRVLAMIFGYYFLKQNRILIQRKVIANWLNPGSISIVYAWRILFPLPWSSKYSKSLILIYGSTNIIVY